MFCLSYFEKTNQKKLELAKHITMHVNGKLVLQVELLRFLPPFSNEFVGMSTATLLFSSLLYHCCLKLNDDEG